MRYRFVTLNTERACIEWSKKTLNFRKNSLLLVKNYPKSRVGSGRIGSIKNFQPRVGSGHENSDPCRTLIYISNKF